jgi:hypothetical protein
MALSCNEIKDRAVKFSKERKDTTNEEADAKPFLDETLASTSLATISCCCLRHSKAKKNHFFKISLPLPFNSVNT